jgi:hypothetical protein
MQLIQKPDLFEFSGNVPEIIVQSTNNVTIKLYDTDIGFSFEETYIPDADNLVKVDYTELLSSLLKLKIPTVADYHQTEASLRIHVTIATLQSFSFTIVKGGVRDLSKTAEEFFKENFLTWQPQIKKIKATQPEWLSAFLVWSKIKLKAYFSDDTNQSVDLTDFVSIPGEMHTVDTSFQHVNSLFEKQVTYYDVWIENTAAQRSSYIQRFILSTEYHENEQFFICGNSLGGIDTIPMTGETKSKKNPKALVGKINGSEIEYGMDFSVTYTQNTGHIDSREKAAWLQDFFLSTQKNLLVDGVILPIVMDKNTIKDSTRNDLRDFSFDFRLSKQSKYQNLTRNMDVLPENLEIATGNDLFFLEPRLSEFPTLAISDTLTFPVMLRYTEKWGQITYATVKQDLLSAVAAMGYVPGDQVGDHVDLSAYALRTDVHIPSQKALLDGLAINANYLQSGGQEVWVANADRLGNLEAVNYWTKQELINDALYLKVGADKIKAGFADLANNSDHLGGIAAADYWNKYNSDLSTKSWTMYDAIVHHDFVTSAFAPGIVGGVGAKIDQSGHGEMKSLDLREFLRTPELIKNQVRVAGNQFWFTDPGLIKEVSGTGPYTLTLKIEEGDGVSFQVDDILIGIFNHNTGFETCYLDVVSVDLENNQVVVNSRNGVDPRQFMQLARKGNKTNSARQTSVFVDGLNGFIRVLGNVDDHVTDFDNIIAQLGYLNMHSPVFGDMEKGLYVKDFGYFENVRVSGEIHVTGGNAETLTGSKDKADAAEAASSALANAAQAKADSAYSLADVKITSEQATVITQNTVTTQFIAALGLKVGDEILMGSNAVISWNNVTGTENVETIIGAQAKVDALVIGGENLVKNSNFEYGFEDWRVWEGSPSVSNNICTVSGSGTVVGILPLYYIDLKKDQKYTLSFEARSDNDFNLNYNYWMRSDGGNAGMFQSSIQLTAEWKKYVYTGSCPFDSVLGSVMISGLTGGVFKSFQIRNVKFELGEKATSWSPNTDDYKKDAQDKADAAEAASSALANAAQGKADSAYALAETKTDAWVTTITQNTVTTAFIAALNLEVGNEIAMGPNAIISWDKVTGTENVETITGAQAKVDAIDVGGRNLLLNRCITGRNTQVIDNGIEIIANASTDTYFYLDPAIDLSIYNGKPLTLSFRVSGLLSENWRFAWKNKYDDNYRVWIKNGINYITLTDSDLNGSQILFDDHNREVQNQPIQLTFFKLEKGNKATDWTPAPEDVNANISSAEAAASALANTAQGKANSAYALAETKTDAWVTTITQNTVTTAFIAALNLEVGNEIAMGSNAVIAWDKVTGTENVETTTGAQSKIDALVIGGENLLDNSNFSDGFTGWSTWGSPTISSPGDGGRRIVMDGYTNGFGAITPRFSVKQGVKYSVSFDAASMYNPSSLNYMYIMKSSGNASLPGVLIDGSTSQYKRYAFSFVSPVTEDISIMFAKVGLGLNDEGFKINNVKIEIGDKATAWTPSLNDMDTNVTSISQNVITTTTVIAEQMKVRAINILDQLTASQINFDNAVGVNVNLSGTINADNGIIGGFFIDDAQIHKTGGSGSTKYGIEIKAGSNPSIDLYRNGSSTTSNAKINFYNGTTLGGSLQSIDTAVVNLRGIELVSTGTLDLYSPWLLRLKSGKTVNVDAELFQIQNAVIRTDGGVFGGGTDIGGSTLTSTTIYYYDLSGSQKTISTNSSYPSSLSEDYDSYFFNSTSGSRCYVSLPSTFNYNHGSRIWVGTRGRDVTIKASYSAPLGWNDSSPTTSGEFGIGEENRWTCWIMFAGVWWRCLDQNL